MTADLWERNEHCLLSGPVVRQFTIGFVLQALMKRPRGQSVMRSASRSWVIRLQKQLDAVADGANWGVTVGKHDYPDFP
ncbi:hypothetical protein EVAR_16624_1 [Eumeta japonica]|uniref:Uncharacterized protein n=1 Tax=Eumeta variegata TaxID=151549 RepID=A0A4C1V031_EUMVA|nr:hypothetical protein EVAR_16624_1 [Eumeta japonica]